MAGWVQKEALGLGMFRTTAIGENSHFDWSVCLQDLALSVMTAASSF